jgi:hypothetical protein
VHTVIGADLFSSLLPKLLLGCVLWVKNLNFTKICNKELLREFSFAQLFCDAVLMCPDVSKNSSAFITTQNPSQATHHHIPEYLNPE